MIDWFFLFLNFLWILGLAWMLAVFSFTRWEAVQTGQKTGKLLEEPKQQLQLNIGAVLFCLGLALVSHRLWETAVWVLFLVWFTVQGFMAVRILKTKNN